MRRSIEELDKTLSLIHAAEKRFNEEQIFYMGNDEVILQEKISLVMALKALEFFGFNAGICNIPGIEEIVIKKGYVCDYLFDVFGASGLLYDRVAEATGWQKIYMPMDYREDERDCYISHFLPVELEDPEWKAFSRACALPVEAQNMIRHELFELVEFGTEPSGAAFYQNSRVIDFLRYCDAHREAFFSPIGSSIGRLLKSGMHPCSFNEGVDGIRDYRGKYGACWVENFISYSVPETGELMEEGTCYSSSRALKLFLLHEYLNLAEEEFHFSSAQEVVA